MRLWPGGSRENHGPTQASRSRGQSGRRPRAAQGTHASPELNEEPRLLNEAALHGQVEIVRLLISSDCDPDGQVPSHEYYRPLHRAIEHRGFAKNPGHRQVVQTLIEAGASLEKRATWMQLLPLAVAGMVGDREMIDLLRKAGSEETIFTAAITADLPAPATFSSANPKPE